MPEIHFKDIDAANNQEVRNLTLKAGQETFIETVDDCLEEASHSSEWHPVGIYYGEALVGFAMYGCFGPQKETWIDRIMIDKKYQDKGLGKAALIKLIDVVSKEYDVDVLYLSIIEGNKKAYHLYKSLGFEYTNERDPNGEFIFKYVVR
ncbi:GNAT family N-acetyltransferase [Pisciglobus halotolerans]|uniref:Diamine N-acetyltransferase n=1 Tax=Pisciglobus halotolerans TaxID=745365 RepID=A0A1I3BSL1_9LACT|nr:GNAT family N-acetyltransferase [Pisciglobus halotolerans]SFH65294.1 diamine N-acetyltransferase [Pisciglobus halotolerans]